MSAYNDNGRWRYRFSRKGKRYGGSTLEGNNTKRAAEQLERAHIEKLEAGVHAGKMPTVREFIARFLAYQKVRVKPLTYKSHKLHLAHVERGIGTTPLDDVDTMAVDHLVTTWRAAGTAPRTINVRLSVLHHLLGLAVEWRILRAFPVIRRVKVPEDTPRFLTEDEARRLHEAAPRKIKSMVLIGLRTGLRVGELRGLQWGDVDLARGMLRVRRTDPGTGAPATAPKGGKGRTVPLTPDARATLAAELEAAKRRGAAGPDRHVWPGRRERPRSAAGCTQTIAAAFERAGIKDEAGDGIGWHTLRHTFASWLVLRGVSLRVVQELLGHASIRQTERYAHLAPDATHHGAVATLDLALAPAEAPAALPPGEEGSDV